MITAVDTSVLLDVFGADPVFGGRSREAVRRCLAEGSLIATGIVWAEIAASFPNPADVEAAMRRLNVAFSPMEMKAAILAGTAFGEYKRLGGTRQRLLADFLIGAHAQVQADRLLTRDRGFNRGYFKSLTIFDPSV